MTSLLSPNSGGPPYSASFATLNQKIKNLSSSSLSNTSGSSNVMRNAPGGIDPIHGSATPKMSPAPNMSSSHNAPMQGLLGMTGPSSSNPMNPTSIPMPSMSTTQFQTPSRGSNEGAYSTGNIHIGMPQTHQHSHLPMGSSYIPLPLSFDALNPYDMQHALNEWRNIQEIVRLSFVTMVDQIKHQQMEIRAIQAHVKKQEEIIEEQANLLNSKATRSEVTLEVNKHLKEIQQAIESRASMVDVVSLLENKMNKDEANKLLSTKANISELKQLSNEKADQNSVNEYLEIHTNDILEIKNILTKKANTIEVVQELQKKASITDVQQALETKANVNDVQEALKHKANKQSVISALAKKVSAPDLEAALAQLKSQVQLELSQQISTKLDAEHINLVENEISTLQNSTQQIRSQLEQKVNTSNFHSLLSQKANRDDVQSQLESQAARLNATLTSGIDDSMQRVNSEMEEIHKKLDLKAEEANLKRIVSIVKEMKTQVEQKANLDHVREALQTKVSQQQLSQLKEELEQYILRSECEEKLTEKANTSELESLRRELTSRVTKEAVGAALKKKVNIADLNNLVEQFTGIENIKNNLIAKADIKDVVDLLAQKADSVEVERVISQTTEIVSQKINAEQYSQALQDQAIINEALLSQNNMGRWIWKNGKLKSGYGVPWNVQVINTSPENFLWEKDRVNIITVQPGLYEIAFGFYGKTTPTIQLHVNGEPVLSTGVDGPGSVVYNKASKRLRQKAGAITGLTHIDFLALPEKARIAISYAGEQKGEGFLTLRKL